jgi:tRNA(adenine34) deaminase
MMGMARMDIGSPLVKMLTYLQSCWIKMRKRNQKRWVARVKTDSTHPPPDLFTKSANTIARTLASKKVSPKGPGSGMRMLTYFINRAGRGLSGARRAELEKAKSLLSKRVQRESTAHKKKAA